MYIEGGELSPRHADIKFKNGNAYVLKDLNSETGKIKGNYDIGTWI
jgi:pSer/pThr/pTyr-binding forkhead associated (FHA) protein